jgi:hypothetical protein
MRLVSILTSAWLVTLLATSPGLAQKSRSQCASEARQRFPSGTLGRGERERWIEACARGQAFEPRRKGTKAR